MTINALTRDERYVVLPADEYKFQRMCLHIYEEQYRSPGASHYGRRGQAQGGKDIYLSDWTTGTSRFPGLVWIECKHTCAGELAWKDLKKSISQAVRSARARPASSRVYLYVVATSARNDAKLLKAYDRYAKRIVMPFKVEFHTWDKLCSFIVKSDVLWNLYGAPPGGSQEDNTLRVSVAMSQIRENCNNDRLADAERVASHLRHGRRSAYGHDDPALPEASWGAAPLLRAAMLELYKRARDSDNALALLRLQVDLGQMRDPLACLAYLRALRIVAHLRVPQQWLLVGDQPSFASDIQALVVPICAMRGSPDVLASLALMVIMECDEVHAHESVLAMLLRLVAYTQGTHEELNARAAYAIVRYFFVLRHGWRDAVCHYALGDAPSVAAAPLLMGDPLLDQPMKELDRGPRHVGYGEPLASPTQVRHDVVGMLARFAQANATAGLLSLPLLAEVGSSYSSKALSSGSAAPMAMSLARFTRRVVDRQTLLALATSRRLDEVARQRELFVTELTYDHLLGYRAILRSYARRTDDKGMVAELLQRLEALVGRCVRYKLDGNAEMGRIHVAAVYDNPPPWLEAAPPIAGYERWMPFPFSLPVNVAVDKVLRLKSLPSGDPLKRRLAYRYHARDHEPSLACLLALLIGIPLLSNAPEFAHEVSFMGIATEHPSHLGVY